MEDSEKLEHIKKAYNLISECFELNKTPGPAAVIAMSMATGNLCAILDDRETLEAAISSMKFSFESFQKNNPK